MKKGFLIFFSLVLLFTLIISVSYNYDDIVKMVLSKKINEQKTVIIDAGHGGFDGGAVASDGTTEKDINLKIAQNLKEFLRYFGFEVKMTRESDVSTESDNGKKNKKSSDLYNRLKVMKENPDAIFVSIHMNKFTSSSAEGAQVFFAPKVESSDILANSIQGIIRELLQPKNDRIIKQGTKNIYILRNATIPATIVECGFISNPQELKLLKDENYQRKMAFSIFCGIIDYYNSIELGNGE